MILTSTETVYASIDSGPFPHDCADESFLPNRTLATPRPCDCADELARFALEIGDETKAARSARDFGSGRLDVKRRGWPRRTMTRVRPFGGMSWASASW